MMTASYGDVGEMNSIHTYFSTAEFPIVVHVAGGYCSTKGLAIQLLVLLDFKLSDLNVLDMRAFIGRQQVLLI